MMFAFFKGLTQECAELLAFALLQLKVTSQRHHHLAANEQQPLGPEPTNDSPGLPLEIYKKKKGRKFC